LKRRAPRSHLFEKLPQRLSTELSAALRSRRKWKSYEGEDAFFTIALSRARWGRGDHRICRSQVGPITVPLGLHRFVRKYRVLHIKAMGHQNRADKVLTWVAFKKLLKLGAVGERVWHQLPDFVNTSVLRRHLMVVKVRNEDIGTDTGS
jgi:hypothetical protein